MTSPSEPREPASQQNSEHGQAAVASSGNSAPPPPTSLAGAPGGATAADGATDQPFVAPGQPPYGQQPYGQPPSGQPPYGQQQPNAQPYGRPQPYGQPPQPPQYFGQPHGYAQAPGTPVYPAAGYPAGAPAPGAPIVRTRIVGLSIAALIIAVVFLIAAGSFLVSGLGGDSAATGLAGVFAIVVAVIGLLLGLAIGISALVMSIRRKNAPSIWMSAGAVVMVLVAAVIAVSGALSAFSYATQIWGSSDHSSPAASPSGDTGYTSGDLIDPMPLGWDDGSDAGTSVPKIRFTLPEDGDWKQSESGDDYIVVASQEARCEVRVRVSALGDPSDPSQDNARSVESLLDSVTIDPATLIDVTLAWSGPSDANEVLMVGRLTETSSGTRLDALRSLNAAPANVRLVVLCDATGADGAAAVWDAYDTVTAGVVVTGK